MTFLAIDISKRSAKHFFDYDKCAMSYVGNEQNGYFIYIKLGRVVVEKTWPQFLAQYDKFRYGLRLAILEGTDTDAGFLMLTPNPSGYRFSSSNAPKMISQVESRAPFVCKIQADKFKNYQPRTAPCEQAILDTTIDGTSMLIQVPEWFIYTKVIIPPKTFEVVTPVRNAIGATPVSKHHPSHRRHG